MSKLPAFPPPNTKDSPEVAAYLRNAAVLWSAHRHRESLALLVRAANSARSRSDVGDSRVVELALAATELAAFVDAGDDPRSIPISIEFNAESVDINSIDLRSIQSSVLDITVEPPRRPSHANVSTLREAERPTPPPAPAPPTPPKPPSRIDLTQTMPQGARPPQPAAPPLNLRVVAPAGTPPASTLKEAPITEPTNERSSALPTKRMEDVPTRRAPDIEAEQKKR